MSHDKHFVLNGWHILCFQGVYQVPMSKYHANQSDFPKGTLLRQPRLQSGAGCSASWGVRLPALIGITICSTGKLTCTLTGAMSSGRGAEPPEAERRWASGSAFLNRRLGYSRVKP